VQTGDIRADGLFAAADVHLKAGQIWAAMATAKARSTATTTTLATTTMAPARRRVGGR
jgi:hypothetical protein